MVEEQELDEAFNPDFADTVDVLYGDPKIAVFVKEFLSNGLNSSLAYKTLHPEVSEQSSRVLGSRMLAKVRFSSLLAVCGLGLQEYIEHLKQGLQAMKLNVETKEQEPDFQIRKGYLEILGKLHRLYKS